MILLSLTLALSPFPCERQFDQAIDQSIRAIQREVSRALDIERGVGQRGVFERKLVPVLRQYTIEFIIMSLDQLFEATRTCGQICLLDNVADSGPRSSTIEIRVYPEHSGDPPHRAIAWKRGRWSLISQETKIALWAIDD